MEEEAEIQEEMACPESQLVRAEPGFELSCLKWIETIFVICPSRKQGLHTLISNTFVKVCSA